MTGQTETAAGMRDGDAPRPDVVEEIRAIDPERAQRVLREAEAAFDERGDWVMGEPVRRRAAREEHAGG